ncbi:MAG: HNH endonuclease [Acidobacteria bacterium]|nr:HNH endonuclease [Acidobacteriota bacterium]
MPKITKACRNCAKIFPVKPSHYDIKSYCSRACMGEDYKKRMAGPFNPNFRKAGLKECLRCGKRFHSYNSKRKYCSHRCASFASIGPRNKSGRKRNYAPARAPKQKNFIFVSLPKTCHKCAQPIQKGRQFCNVCSPIGKGKIKSACQICNKIFLDNRARPSKTCSRKCYGKMVSIRQKGEQSHLWQGGKTKEAQSFRNSATYDEWRREVFARDDWTCQICKKRGGRLTAHHILRFSQRRDLALVVENGITLCWPCHTSIRHKEEKYEAQFLEITGGNFRLDPDEGRDEVS